MRIIHILGDGGAEGRAGQPTSQIGGSNPSSDMCGLPLCPWEKHFTHCPYKSCLHAWLVVVRRADGADWQPRFCQSIPAQLRLQQLLISTENGVNEYCNVKHLNFQKKAIEKPMQ